MKRLESPWGAVQCVFILDFIFAWVLTEKYSGGDYSARKLILMVCIPLLCACIFLSTLLWSKRKTNAYWFFLCNSCTMLSFMFMGLSGALPVFFKYPIGTTVGAFLLLFFILLILITVLYTISFFVINKEKILSFVLDSAKKTSSILEKELLGFMPDKFILWNKSPILLNLILLASEVLGLNLRGAYPNLSAILISVPLFCIAVCFIQMALIHMFFAKTVKSAGEVLSVTVLVSEGTRKKKR